MLLRTPIRWLRASKKHDERNESGFQATVSRTEEQRGMARLVRVHDGDELGFCVLVFALMFTS